MTKTKALSVKKPYTNEQIKLITRTVAKGANTDELGLFFNVAKRMGLDPFSRQIHLIPRRQSDGTIVRTTQVGIDGYLAVAERSKQLAGIDDAIFDDGAKPEAGKGEPNQPTKASVTVYRNVKGERVPFTASARWKEYYPGDKLGFMWKKMPYAQLAKCALALALRKAFPSDLSGVYVHEEMESQPAEEIVGTPVEGKVVEGDLPEYFCSECGNIIDKTVHDYSSKMFGRPLCREDQKNANKQ